jgi:hypothetical protein
MSLNMYQHKAVIASILSLNPDYWPQSVQEALKSVCEQDRGQFFQDWQAALHLAAEKRAHVSRVLTRNLVPVPSDNVEAWILVHDRFLAPLFIKHVSILVVFCSS